MKELRKISYEEFNLMCQRLVLKVQEYPEMFQNWSNGQLQQGVTDFIEGENHRRDLFVQPMDNLIESLDLVKKYNDMDIEEFAQEYAEYSNQEISQEVIDKFKFTGLNNIDFIRSNFLKSFDLKPLNEL